MPLRDHFRPPVSDRRPWDFLHGMWSGTMIQRLFPLLPERYYAAPHIHLVVNPDLDQSPYVVDASPSVRTALAPTLTVETEWPDQEEYEMRVYDDEDGGRLVAAVEIVSPANKDRPESRKAFVAKCAALLQQDVCVSIVDVVTTKQFNLYADVMELLERTDPALGAEPPPVYAVTLRGRKRERKRPLLDVWFYPLAVGQPLPPLPIWLDIDLPISLDLEGSYEDACRVLRIA